MRLFLACLVVLLAPSAAIVGWKHYESLRAHQGVEQPQWHTRGEVLFFNAKWCGPCRQMKPIVAELRRKGYRLRDVDVDQNHALAEKYGVRGIPTFVFVENGREVKRFTGGTSADRLMKMCSAPAYR